MSLCVIFGAITCLQASTPTMERLLLLRTCLPLGDSGAAPFSPVEKNVGFYASKVLISVYNLRDRSALVFEFIINRKLKGWCATRPRPFDFAGLTCSPPSRCLGSTGAFCRHGYQPIYWILKETRRAYAGEFEVVARTLLMIDPPPPPSPPPFPTLCPVLW